MAIKKYKITKKVKEVEEFLESTRYKYIAEKITAEQALEAIAKNLGFEMSFCRCMYKELEFRDNGLYCPNCNKLVPKFKN